MRNLKLHIFQLTIAHCVPQWKISPWGRWHNMIPFNALLLDIFVPRRHVKMNQTWQIICCVPHMPWRHQSLWFTNNEKECFVLFIQRILFNWFLSYCQIWWVLPNTILFAWHDKLFKSTYSLAVVTGSCPLLSFWKTNKSLNPPKCTCCMHHSVSGDGNVTVSMVRNWLMCQSGS